MDKSSLFARTARLARTKGPAHLLRVIAAHLVWRMELLFYRIFKAGRTFSFQGKSYPYFWHLYTVTWKNERAIEIPIFREWVERDRGKRILEVGNVLSHYFPVDHDVVDKHEKGEGVTNQDIVDYRPPKRYDLVVSISTLEHVGWDEEPKDPEKIPRAVAHMQGLLAPGGKLALSAPLGYNPVLDALLDAGELPFAERHHFKRVSRDRWAEAGWEEVRGAKYGEPYSSANGLVIGTWENARPSQDSPSG